MPMCDWSSDVCSSDLHRGYLLCLDLLLRSLLLPNLYHFGCNFLEEISSLSHSVVFLYFFALFTEEGHDRCGAGILKEMSQVCRLQDPNQEEPETVEETGL